MFMTTGMFYCEVCCFPLTSSKEGNIFQIEIMKIDLDLNGHKGPPLPPVPYDPNILGSYAVSTDMLLCRPLSHLAWSSVPGSSYIMQT